MNVVLTTRMEIVVPKNDGGVKLQGLLRRNSQRKKYKIKRKKRKS
jgi:hypothetical protein